MWRLKHEMIQQALFKCFIQLLVLRAQQDINKLVNDPIRIVSA